MSEQWDVVDEHITRWRRVLPGLDPEIEGPVTRMQHLVRHLKRVRQAALAEHGLHPAEYDTLHALAGHGEPYQANPTDLASELQMSPAAMTGRIDGLERRGFVHRESSADDRRRVVVRLTPAGQRAWRAALDQVGDEEVRLLGTLSRADRRQLDDLLRRLVLALP